MTKFQRFPISSFITDVDPPANFHLGAKHFNIICTVIPIIRAQSVPGCETELTGYECEVKSWLSSAVSRDWSSEHVITSVNISYTALTTLQPLQI